MNYSIDYSDDKDSYTDKRSFNNIEITPQTKITTGAKKDVTTTLLADYDGDGVTDDTFTAGVNEDGKVLDNGDWARKGVALVCAFWVLVIAVGVICFVVRRQRAHRRAP